MKHWMICQTGNFPLWEEECISTFCILSFVLFVFLFILCFFSYFCQDDLPHQKLPPCEMRNALVFPTILLDSHLITFQWHDKDTHTKTKTKTGINAPSPQGPGVRGEMHFKFLTILLDSHPIREFFFSTNCQSISLLEQLLSIQYNVVNYTAPLPIGNLPKRLLVPLWQVAFLSLIALSKRQPWKYILFCQILSVSQCHSKIGPIGTGTVTSLYPQNFEDAHDDIHMYAWKCIWRLKCLKMYMKA